MDLLLPEIRILARISACVAQRDETFLEHELKDALRAGIDLKVLREVLLQTYLFAGYAATINAFVVLNRMVPGEAEFFQEEEKSLESWRSRGEKLCELIYADHYSKLMQNMT